MARIIATIFYILTIPSLASAVVTLSSPHDSSNGITCISCHASHRDNLTGASLYNNACLSCHRPGDATGGKKPFTSADQADPFGVYTSTSPKPLRQTSHRFSGKIEQMKAGSELPQSLELSSKLSTFNNELACSVCHNQHDNANGKFLRVANNRDQLCLDCHRSRNVQDHKLGSHPVFVGYSAAYRNSTTSFRPRPVNANQSNPTAAIKLLSDDRISCSSCHSVHNADSRSSTEDGANRFANLSSGDGNLLRTDMKGISVNPAINDYLNICSNCHRNKYSHNGRNQNIQCTDCHGAHVGSNVFLVREQMKGSGVQTVFTSSTRINYADAAGNGVCQACHEVPQDAGYPQEHTLLVNCSDCHKHSASISSGGSFAATGGCTVCHGYPPMANHTGGPDGYANGSPFTNESSSGHRTHASRQGYAKQCIECHSGNSHRSGTYQDVFKKAGPLLSRFTSAGGKPVYNSTDMTCSSVYCHSNGMPRGGMLVTQASTPSWNNGFGAITKNPDRCNKCHNGTSATLDTNAHKAHLAYSVSCANCHSKSPSDPSFVIYSGNLHVNGQKDVVFGFPDTSGVWNSSAGTCNNIYCHSNGQSTLLYMATPAWEGGSVTCGSCHGESASNQLTAPHASHANNAATIGTNYGCVDCHAKTVNDNATVSFKANHVNRFIDVSGARVRAMSSSQITSGSCTTYCHSNGAGGAPNQAVTWSSSKLLDCGGCHNSVMTTSSHSKHVSGVTDCIKCHRATTESGTAILTGSTSHTNMTVDVRLSQANGYTNYTGLYDRGTKSCSATYCHGSGSSPVWGSSSENAVCTICHGTPSPNDYDLNRAPDVGAHFVHLGGAGYNAYMKVLSCSDCHSVPSGSTSGFVGHLNGIADVSFNGSSTASKNAVNPSWNPGTAPNGTCSLYCHGASLPLGDTSGSARSLQWIADVMTGVKSNDCGLCHGNPPTSGATQSIHSAIVPTTSCGGCHPHFNNSGEFDSESNRRLHINGSVDASGACNVCHGYPPTSGKHDKHASGTANYSYSCSTCHYTTTHDGENLVIGGTHKDGSKNVVFAFYTSSEPILRTTSWDSGTLSCTNIYCHSNGQSLYSPSNAVNWSSAVISTACDACHHAPSSMVSGSHSQHISNGIECFSCHYSTIQNSATSGNVSKSNHANQRVNISFFELGSNAKYGGYSASSPAEYSKTPGSAYKTCSTTLCHGSVSPVWGDNAGRGCTTCHDYDTVGAEYAAGVWSGGYWGKMSQDGLAPPEGYGAHAKHINYIKTRLTITTVLDPVNQAFGLPSSENVKVCGTCHSNNIADHISGGRSIFTQTGGGFPFVIGGSGGTTLLFVEGTDPVYNGASGVSASIQPKTCSNLSCHYFTSPSW